MEPCQSFLDLQIRNVCFLGAGFVGGPTAAVLAAYVPGIKVTVADINPTRIRAWNSDTLPISEPGLLELVQQHRALESSTTANNIEASWERNLRFTTDVETGIIESEVIFLCVDTSQSNDENGLDNPPDLANLKRAVSKVGETAIKDFIIVEKSTVPCGTAQLIRSILSTTLRRGISYQILSNPEFLAEGSAIRDLKDPDRVLIGASDNYHGRHAAQILSRLYENWVPRDKILNMDTWSSELSKLCANALLAQRISSMNSFSMICERTGADVRSIAEAVKRDHRIGPHMLNPSVGFGGSCFQKDIAHLVYLAKSLDLNRVAQYWLSVLTINQAQKDSFAERVCQRLAGQPSVITNVVIFGFAFKAHTNDVRNSAAIDIVNHLIGENYNVRIYDPWASESDIFSALGTETFSKRNLGHTLRVCANPYEACESASAVVVLTEWKEFELGPTSSTVDLPIHQLGREEEDGACHNREKFDSFIDSGLGSPSSDMTQSTYPLDWARIARSMVEPRYIFDGRNIVDDAAAAYGFQVERIGKNANSMAMP